MGLLSDLYNLGASGVGGETDSATSAAIVGVNKVHALAVRLDKDVQRSAVRPLFRKAWASWFNGWTTYRMLHAERACREAPDRVLREDLPKWLGELLRLRSAFAAEGGTLRAAVGSGAGGARSSMPWGWIMGGVAVAVGAGLVWYARAAHAEDEADVRARLALPPGTGGPGPTFNTPVVLPIAYPFQPPPAYPPMLPPRADDEAA